MVVISVLYGTLMSQKEKILIILMFICKMEVALL